SALPALVRAGVEATRGRHQEAVVEAEKALQQAPKQGRVLRAAACVWSLAAGAASRAGPAGARLAQQYADRAVALLAEALGRGFHDLSYPEHNRLADDPALAQIRQLPRVRALLARRP